MIVWHRIVAVCGAHTVYQSNLYEVNITSVSSSFRVVVGTNMHIYIEKILYNEPNIDFLLRTLSVQKYTHWYTYVLCIFNRAQFRPKLFHTFLCCCSVLVTMVVVVVVVVF